MDVVRVECADLLHLRHVPAGGQALGQCIDVTLDVTILDRSSKEGEGHPFPSPPPLSDTGRSRPFRDSEPAPKEPVGTAGADIPGVLDRGLLVIVRAMSGNPAEFRRLVPRQASTGRLLVDLRAAPPVDLPTLDESSYAEWSRFVIKDRQVTS